MNTFEYITVLVAIVIGLAIADIVTSLHRLFRAWRRVKWDWISPLAAMLVLLELFNVWWRRHGFSGTTLGQVIPYFAIILLLFLAASASLPDEVPAEGLDLAEYFDETRPYFWASYAAFVISWVGLRTALDIGQGLTISQIFADRWFDYLGMPIYVALIFVKRRLWSGLALLATLLYLALDWWGLSLA